MIDREGIDGRIVPLPIEAGNLTALTAGTDGQIYYIRRVGGYFEAEGPGWARQAVTTTV